MAWRTEVSGGIQRSLVDRQSVDALVRTIGDRNIYLAVAAFFGGGLLSAVPTLASDVKHATAIYFLMAVEAVIVVVFLILFFRECNHVSQRSDELDEQGLVYTLTPPSGTWAPTPNPPQTGTQSPNTPLSPQNPPAAGGKNP
jgi:hypothetical protein